MATKTPIPASATAKLESKPEPKPRWLTMEEICEELRLTPATVWGLVRRHKIVGLTSKNRMHSRNWRFLDPSPEYKKALYTQETILSFSHSIDLMRFPVIATAELAEIAGIKPSTLRNFIQDGTLKPSRVGRYAVFTIEQVREFLLSRERREPRDRRVRSEMLIRWALKQLAGNREPTMSEEEVQRDDELEGALRRIMRQREPARSLHLKEFWRRFELVQAAVRVTREGFQE